MFVAEKKKNVRYDSRMNDFYAETRGKKTNENWKTRIALHFIPANWNRLGVIGGRHLQDG